MQWDNMVLLAIKVFLEHPASRAILELQVLKVTEDQVALLDPKVTQENGDLAGCRVRVVLGDQLGPQERLARRVQLVQMESVVPEVNKDLEGYRECQETPEPLVSPELQERSSLLEIRHLPYQGLPDHQDLPDPQDEQVRVLLDPRVLKDLQARKEPQWPDLLDALDPLGPLDHKDTKDSRDIKVSGVIQGSQACPHGMERGSPKGLQGPQDHQDHGDTKETKENEETSESQVLPEFPGDLQSLLAAEVSRDPPDLLVPKVHRESLALLAMSGSW